MAQEKSQNQNQPKGKKKYMLRTLAIKGYGTVLRGSEFKPEIGTAYRKAVTGDKARKIDDFITDIDILAKEAEERKKKREGVS